MNDQQIQELINQFDTEKLKENAYFGFLMKQSIVTLRLIKKVCCYMR